MNSTIETISPLRQRFLDEMRMRKLSPQDPKRLSPHRQPVLWLAGTLTRHCDRRRFAMLPTASSRPRDLADLTQSDALVLTSGRVNIQIPIVRCRV